MICFDDLEKHEGSNGIDRILMNCQQDYDWISTI